MSTNTNPVRTTIPVSVTVKIDVKGSSPDELVKNAAFNAAQAVDEAFAHHYPEHEYLHGSFEYDKAGYYRYHISVEGAKPLVEQEALEKLFAQR